MRAKVRFSDYDYKWLPCRIDLLHMKVACGHWLPIPSLSRVEKLHHSLLHPCRVIHKGMRAEVRLLDVRRIRARRPSGAQQPANWRHRLRQKQRMGANRQSSPTQRPLSSLLRRLAFSRRDVRRSTASRVDLLQLHTHSAVQSSIHADARRLLAAAGIAGKDAARSVSRRLSDSCHFVGDWSINIGIVCYAFVSRLTSQWITAWIHRLKPKLDNKSFDGKAWEFSATIYYTQQPYTHNPCLYKLSRSYQNRAKCAGAMYSVVILHCQTVDCLHSCVGFRIEIPRTLNYIRIPLGIPEPWQA